MPTVARALPFVLLLLACGSDAGKDSTKADADKADAGKTDAAKASTERDAKLDTKAPPPFDGKSAYTWSFDAESPGGVAKGFDPVQTGEKVEPAATWAIATDFESPSAPNAFGVTKTVGVNKTFNTALVPGSSYKDFELSVNLLALSGANNQGGGVMFRAKGTDDHYIARWNPVENNFRIYALLGGARVDIAAASLELDAKAWHELRVRVVGDRIECFVDDKPIVQANDKSLPDAGMIGLWTKGDAATLFDDLTITPE